MFVFLSGITLMKYFCLVCVCMCVSYRARAEKQRMYSVSQGLNSGWTNFLALSTSADLALRRSSLWVWIWRSTSRLVLARRADSWIYRENKVSVSIDTCAQSQHRQIDYLSGGSCRANVVCLPARHVRVLLSWTVQSEGMSALLTVVPGLPCWCRSDPLGAPCLLWGFGGFTRLWYGSPSVSFF